jgi:hypothetical protein
VRRALVLILLAGLVAAPSAVAAPPWSAPQDLSTAHTFVDAPALLFSGRGTALASWRTQDGVIAIGTVGADAATRPAGATRFGPERPIATARTQAQRPPLVVGAVPYASSRTLAATVRPELAIGERTRLAVVFGDDTGRFGTPRTIAVQDGLRDAGVAADAAGDAAVAWFQDVGVTNDRVFVALRRPGGAFGAPIRLATDRVRSVSVAVSPRGDVLVAWDARGTVRARIRRAGARSFDTTQSIASRPAFHATLRTAMTARGRAYVGWTAQRLSEGGGVGPFTAEVAVRPVGAARFRPAQLLEEQSRGAVQAGVDLAVDGEDATFAWAGLYAGLERIRVVSTNTAAVFRGLQDVSPAGVGAVDPTLATDGGRRLVAWVQTPPADETGVGSVLAALASAGGTFSAAEAITTGPAARTPDAAFAPGGAPTVVWSNRPAGGTVPLAQIKSYAQASTRAG